MNDVPFTEEKPVITAGELLESRNEIITELRAALADYYVAAQGGPAVPTSSQQRAYEAAVELGAFPQSTGR